MEELFSFEHEALHQSGFNATMSDSFVQTTITTSTFCENFIIAYQQCSDFYMTSGQKLGIFRYFPSLNHKAAKKLF